MGDAVPQTPWDLALLLTRMDAFPFTENGACRTIDLLARRIGQRRDATRAPMQVRNGRRPHGRLLRQQPALYLRTAVFLSKQPGPPHPSYLVINGLQLQNIGNPSDCSGTAVQFVGGETSLEVKNSTYNTYAIQAFAYVNNSVSSGANHVWFHDSVIRNTGRAVIYGYSFTRPPKPLLRSWRLLARPGGG
jgi:hypothetical protein